MRYLCKKGDDGRPFIRIVGEMDSEHGLHAMFRPRLGERLEVTDYKEGLGTEIRVVGIPIDQPEPTVGNLPDDQENLETVAAEEGVSIDTTDKPHQIKHKITTQRKAKSRKS